MKNPVCRTCFDTRDLIEYLDFLKTELTDNFNNFHKEKDENFEEVSDIEEVIDEISDIEDENSKYQEFAEVYDTELTEYKDFKQFCEELENNSADYEYGETVIHEDYFRDYAEEFMRDCGYVGKDLPPIIENNIDWDGIAEDLKADFSEVEFEGDTYYIRS